ncbi:hypothetical protein N431DRAFT_448759 [Stipitochalara longipes BDJ]|nr:hypothetical protein N431DRAFT_448759 [Stipitochalara longipes BDJ]
MESILLVVPGSDHPAGSDISSSESLKNGSTGSTEQRNLKKRRRKNEKSRTGCLTCKIRRVKCDEAKPHCLICTSTARKCDGYPSLSKVEHAVDDNPKKRLILPAKGTASPSMLMQGMTSLLLRDSLLDFKGTKLEHRHLDFFYSQTAPSLAGYFDSRFWSILVPQLACSEPSVQHAMIALASFHEHCNAEDSAIVDHNTSHRQFTIRQYNKAIKYMKAYKHPQKQDPMTILTTCILFICLEFMRGDINQALAHITSGVQILQSLPLATQPGVASPSLSIQTDISDTFTRLTLQARLCGRQLPSLPPESLPIVLGQDGPLTPFATLFYARHSLSIIMVSALPFVNSALTLKFAPDEEHHKTLTATRQIILTQLDLWKARMDLTQFSPSNANVVTDISANILLISYIMSKIWTRTAIYPDESAWDTQLLSFKEILTLCTEVITNSGERRRRGPYSLVGLPRASPKRPVWRDAFTFEMGIIPSLYFVAIKCRDPAIRREAIRLLGLARPRKEGLWNARNLTSIAERVIETEEDGIVEPEWPAEEKRVHDAQWANESLESTTVQKVVFFVRPTDAEGQGQWEFREEMIPWR